MNGAWPRNLLLDAMSDGDRNLIGPIERVGLVRREYITKADSALSHVYFPEGAVSSLSTIDANGTRAEITLLGNEGVSGVSLVYGESVSTFDTQVQVSGQAVRIPARRFKEAMRRSATLQGVLLRYALTFQAQLVSAVIANAVGTTDQRLARWILMYQDRVGGDHLHVSHDGLADALSVRRASITDAIHRTEHKGYIRSERMDLKICSRRGLIRTSNGLYGQAEAEYERIMGFAPAARTGLDPRAAVPQQAG